MMKKQIRNIVFDLGNVLNKCDIDYAVRELAAFSTLDAEAIYRWLNESDIIDRFDIGALSGDEFHAELSKRIGWSGTLESLIKIWENMLVTDNIMVELVRKLKRQGYNIYVLSNINPFHVRLINGPLSFIIETDGYVFSCECQMIKPDPRIFHHLIKQFGLDSTETLFIDDREVNVEAARSLGITSILHESYAETRRQLATHCNLALG